MKKAKVSKGKSPFGNLAKPVRFNVQGGVRVKAAVKVKKPKAVFGKLKVKTP